MFKIYSDLMRYNIEFAIGFFLFVFVVIFATLSFFSPVDPKQIYMLVPDVKPNAQYWFGTNSRGQDLFWQMTFAVRNSLLFGFTVAIMSRVLSLVIGLVSGYAGGWVDRILMFVNDIFVSIPVFPILVLFFFVLRDDLTTLSLAILVALLGWAFDARLIRSMMLSLKHREFTQHARFSGMPMYQIVLKEHLPYIMPIVFSTALANMIWSIGIEVTLAVLGFSNIDIPTFGTMLYWANNHSAMIAGIWWWILIPVIFIAMTFLGLYLLSVSLNEYIDPRQRLRRMGGGS